MANQDPGRCVCVGGGVGGNPGRFAPDPVRPLDVSPQRRFAPGGFAPGRFAPLVVSPLVECPKKKNQPILFKSMCIVSANIFAMLYASSNVVKQLKPSILSAGKRVCARLFCFFV